jgi:tetrahydromethanopterin S-methyltransferase subunit D
VVLGNEIDVLCRVSTFLAMMVGALSAVYEEGAVPIITKEEEDPLPNTTQPKPEHN